MLLIIILYHLLIRMSLLTMHPAMKCLSRDMVLKNNIKHLKMNLDNLEISSYEIFFSIFKRYEHLRHYFLQFISLNSTKIHSLKVCFILFFLILVI